MNPSEANVFSSGISGCLSSKKRKDVSYSRLNQTEDDSVEFSNVHFQKDRTSVCSKVCFSLLALILLFATVATAVFMMNLRNFTVEVQLERGNVRVYSFDQELTAITGNEITARNMSIVVSMHLINRTESHCWFGIVLSFPEDVVKTSLQSKDHVFLTHVRSAELGSIEDSLQNHFKVFGSHETSQELSFYVHNILHQLLPTIKVKLYEYVLSKVSSSSRRTVVEKHGFLPGRVRVKQTMITKRDMVTVTAQAGPDDFESFSNPEKGKTTEKASWKLTYDETTVVNKETGMVKRNDMSLSCNLPIGADFTPESKSSRHGLAVRFRSVVKLLDTPHSKVKTWKNALQKAEKDINYPLNLPNAKRSSLMYFAPRKHKSKGRLAEEVKELMKLGKNSAGRSTKLPSMIKIVRNSIPKSVNAQESDADGNDDDDYTNFYNEGSDDGDVNDNEDDNDNDDDNNGQYWPQPDYAPFGIGYEVKRRRSVEKKRPQHTKRQKTVSKSQMQKKTPKLDVIWDELVSSSPKPLREAPRTIQTTILGLDFRAEIDYQVESNDGDDENNANDEEDDVEDWSITTSYRITFGQYRVTPFTRVHTLKKLRNKLPLRGQRKISRSTINAGDFVSQSLTLIQSLFIQLETIQLRGHIARH